MNNLPGWLDAIILVGAVLTIYFVPTIVANYRKAKYTTGIFILNLFLGWTLFMWVGALVWAVSSPRGENSGA